jgi:hypothetical protein
MHSSVFELILLSITLPAVCFLLWVLVNFHRQSRLPRSGVSPHPENSDAHVAIYAQNRYRNRSL